MKFLLKPKNRIFLRKFVVILALFGFSLISVTNPVLAQTKAQTAPENSNQQATTQQSAGQTPKKTVSDYYNHYVLLKDYYSKNKPRAEDREIYQYYQRLEAFFSKAKVSTGSSVTLEDGRVLGFFDVPFPDIPSPPGLGDIIGGLNPLNLVGKVFSCFPNPLNCVTGGISGTIEELLGGILRTLAEIPLKVATEILGLVFESLLVILQKIFWFGLEIFTGFLGFSIRGVLQSGFCALFLNDPNFSPIKGIIGENNQNPEMVNRLNAFVLLDFGYSGLYQSFPSVGPVTNIAAEFRDVLGISTANAQGVGTDALGSGLRDIWAKVRDATLVFMVLVLVVIGFMVMLRKRLDPRTVVTATNSLPRIAIALILIVFSFAIAGLFIDLIYLMVGVVRSYFGNNLFGSISGFIGGELVWFPVFSALTFSSIFNWSALLCQNPLILLPFISSPFALLGIMILVMIVEFLLRLLLIIVGVYLFWVLLKNYAYMIVFTIFSPVFFIIGALPGFEGVTANWFKRMLVYALVFPIVIVFLYIAIGLLGLNSLWSGGVNVKAPPPLESNLVNIPYLLAIGIIFFATKVPQFLESIFKVGGMDIRGGIGPSALLLPVGAPLAAAQRLSKAAGPVMAVTGSAGVALAQKGGVRGFVGRGLGLVHDAVRPFGGNINPYDATGDPSKTMDRSFKQKLTDQYNIRNARGEIVKSGFDAASRARERWIEDRIRTTGDPIKTYRENRETAEKDWLDNYSSATGVPSLTPDRVGNHSEIVSKMNDYQNSLRAKGMPEKDVDAAMDKFIKNGFKP